MKTTILSSTEKKVKAVSTVITVLMIIGALYYIAKTVSIYAPMMFKF